MGKSVQEIATEQVLKRLEEGVVPWRQPWNDAFAMNWKREYIYKGLNMVLLPPGEYASKKEILDSGGWIKKEELKNYRYVFFYKKYDSKEEDDDGEKIVKSVFRYTKVWEINTQVEGLTTKIDTGAYNHDPLLQAEGIVKGYQEPPKIQHKPGEAVYFPKQDKIQIPHMSAFPKVEEYYNTLFHEMVHSTGHQERLNRKELITPAAFGSEIYSKEELTAEMGAAMLCNICSIDNSTIDQSASYIQSWIKKLQNDTSLVPKAAAKARQAIDHIQGITYQ